MRKNTGGIYGITFVIQTSAYDPRYCITKILEFLDTFYHQRFTEELFDKYKTGLMAKKAGGFEGLVDEGDFLFSRMVSFRNKAIEKPDWGAKDIEYKHMQDLEYSRVKSIYKVLFAPEPDAQRVLLRRKSTVLEFNAYTEFTKHLGRKGGISLDEFRDMLEARGDIKNAEDVTIEELR